MFLTNFFATLISKLRAPWLSNSGNRPDAMLTFAAVGLTVACVSLMIGVIENITVGTTSLSFEKPDTTLVLGILSATLGAYVLRRNKKDGLDFEEKKLEVEAQVITVTEEKE